MSRLPSRKSTTSNSETSSTPPQASFTAAGTCRTASSSKTCNLMSMIMITLFPLSMIVECTQLSDIQAVLHEGMKNRKSGSHELNKDSSRSHSILTAYLIGEVNSGGQLMKRYGKFSFVDLAGSERLKESKS